MRKKATDALIACGIPMNQSGFLYIVDIMELYEEHGSPMTNMDTVYRIIGKKRNTDPKYILENISWSINFGSKNCRTRAFVNYFGFTDKTNGNYLAFMYQRLKEEESERNKNH